MVMKYPGLNEAIESVAKVLLAQTTTGVAWDDLDRISKYHLKTAALELTKEAAQIFGNAVHLAAVNACSDAEGYDFAKDVENPYE